MGFCDLIGFKTSLPIVLVVLYMFKNLLIKENIRSLSMGLHCIGFGSGKYKNYIKKMQKRET